MANRLFAIMTPMALGALLLPLALGGQPQGGQPKAAGKGGLKPPAELTKMLLGVSACSGCHVEPPKRFKNLNPDLARCVEVPIWHDQDKHKKANEVLKAERGQQIGKRLGIADVTTDRRCIGCHGTLVVDPGSEKDDLTIIKDEGVTCMVCHGTYKDWVDPHASAIPKDRQAWRDLSRKDKEAGWGMRDLWDAETRARLCISCHVGDGDPKSHKRVTHDMYAAGHPPLPGIEVSWFCEQMPRHWQFLSEKTDVVKKILDYHDDYAERSAVTAIGGVMAFREAMSLTASFADEGAKAGAWPELAVFDCYACHHDLRTGGWRQKRGYVGKPGRPELRPWPAALLDLGIAQAAGEDGAARTALHKRKKELLADLDKAVTDRPFGSAHDIAAASKKLIGFTEDLAKKMRTPLTKASAKKLLHVLGDIVEQPRLLDFDSARQVAWAFAIIQEECWPDAKGPELAKWKKDSEQRLRLTLPKGQVAIADGFLEKTLDSLYVYDPFTFKSEFRSVLKSFPGR